MLFPDYTLNTQLPPSYHPVVYVVVMQSNNSMNLKKNGLDTFAQLLEKKGTSFVTILDAAGEPTFKIYKVQL